MALTKIQGPSANSLILSGTTTANGNETVNGTLLVQGATTVNAALTVNGTLTVNGVVLSASPWALLYKNTGTDAGAGAADSDTFAISGLTVDDILIIEATLEATSGSAQMRLRNTTDSVVIGLSEGNLDTNVMHFTWKLSAAQSNTKHIAVQMIDPPTPSVVVGQVAFTTDWTGNWTLALSHATNTGTIVFRWRVYKLKGQ